MNSDSSNEEATIAEPTVLVEILKTLTKMEERMGKIERKFDQIERITFKLEEIENAVKTINERNEQTENSFVGLSTVVDDVINQCTGNKQEIQELKLEMEKIGSEVKKSNTAKVTDQSNVIQKMEESLIDLKCRSMKNNLIFSGLQYQKDEHVEEKLRNFLQNELKINHRIEFGNAHRFGKQGFNGTRPIVARFLFRKDLEMVLSSAYHLRGKPFGIKEQFPFEIEQARKKLYPILKKAKQDGKMASLVRDKLFINGKLYMEEKIKTHSQTPAKMTQQKIEATNQSPPIPPRSKRARTESDNSPIRRNLRNNIYNASTSTSSDTCNSPRKNISAGSDLNILCLNCCGIKSRVNYPEFKDIIDNHEIVCLVETKTDDIDVINLPGYEFKMKNRKKVTKTRSGGITVGYKEHLKTMIEIIDTECKYVMWFQVNGKAFNLDKPVVFGVVYIPPEYTRYSSDEAVNEIEQEFLRFSNISNYICLLGDFNARTGCDDDFVIINEDEHGDNNLSDFIENPINALEALSIPTKRESMDKGKNRYGNMLLNFCKGNGVFILNGRLGRDQNIGRFTCRNASVVDYCISTPELLKTFKDFEVLDSKKIAELEYKLTNTDLTVVNKNIINSLIDDLCNIFVKSGKTTFGTYTVKQTKKRGDFGNKNKPWFDEECKFARQNYRKLKRRFKSKNHSKNHSDMLNAEKAYKNILDSKFRNFRKDLSDKIQNLRGKNPKEYWKILNQNKRKKQPDIDIGKLHDFFKNLNAAPEDEKNVQLPEINPMQCEQMNEHINSPFSKDEILQNTIFRGEYLDLETGAASPEKWGNTCYCSCQPTSACTTIPFNF
ncbi:unnamed protein product [Mytilus edulis]|uniref:Endonuclease/exonuclease/phosphatase domain-containing protein n=1 Tax=Mytilus edulis TaxID=6550 RepID=A0A8S3S5F9_MYTED|nr:unnamed protein product [Mytilus edulis]